MEHNLGQLVWLSLIIRQPATSLKFLSLITLSKWYSLVWCKKIIFEICYRAFCPQNNFSDIPFSVFTKNQLQVIWGCPGNVLMYDSPIFPCPLIIMQREPPLHSGTPLMVIHHKYLESVRHNLALLGKALMYSTTNNRLRHYHFHRHRSAANKAPLELDNISVWL